MTDDYLAHYGILRRSGRYPWGSGEDSEQNNRQFLGYVDDLRSKGVSEVDIAKGLGVTTTQLRAARTIAKTESRKADAALAMRLKAKGMSNVAIGERMGIPESSVRSLLDPSVTAKLNVLTSTSDLLKGRVDSEHYLDIGAGTSSHLGISSTKLAAAVAILREQGYEVHNVQVSQLGTGNKTTIKVLAPPGTTYGDIVRNQHRIGTVAAYSEDGGLTYLGIKPPVSVDSKRIGVRYAEQGGAAADGVIYVRPGVPDVSLGKSRYAQVRVAVDNTHYLKGMAMYNNNLPHGVDLLFNTNKHDTGNKLDAMKPLKSDEDNPFGSVIRQRHYTDEHGKEHLSPMNIVNEEGDWRDWSKTLSSQMLSKQGTGLARTQLALALQTKRDELAEIDSLTNPIVKKKLLETFADGADSAAVHLKAAPLPGQGTHVILPIENMKENEIFAPEYHDGQRVALVRFPHGGTFEIPELTVNNKHAGARQVIGSNSADAVGIHPKVAERLSGADFDGDTVLVIPNNRGAVKTSPPLEGLKNFYPKVSYGPYDGMRTIDGGVYNAATRSVDYGGKKPSGRAKQQQMGDVSNLITDMTIKGAKPEEIARAVRHSMVVIDAEKHHLNYKQSYADNGIPSLKERYQGRGSTGRLAGASTIISRASSEIRVPDRRPRSAAKGGPVDPLTGRKVYEETGETYVDRRGRTVPKTIASTRLAETHDAHTLSSGTPIETVYADHSNALKALANNARKSALGIRNITVSPSARVTYAKEVDSLNAKLNMALKRKPLERQAQLIANAVVSAKVADNPGMEAPDLTKIKGQALNAARDRVGIGKKSSIDITQEEWNAIQAGAISTNKLAQILDNTNLDRIKELATPRTARGLTPTKLARAKAMLEAGYTRADVAAALGVSTSTLYSALNPKG